MNISTLHEITRSREPYKPHKGSFIVDIGNGIDPNKYDYAAILQQNESFVVLVKHGSSVIAFDGTRFIKNDFSHPLNYKSFSSSEEAYEKLIRWIGKMVKKDERGRYYNDRAYKNYAYDESEFEESELRQIAEIIKKEI